MRWQHLATADKAGSQVYVCAEKGGEVHNFLGSKRDLMFQKMVNKVNETEARYQVTTLLFVPYRPAPPSPMYCSPLQKVMKKSKEREHKYEVKLGAGNTIQYCPLPGVDIRTLIWTSL